MTEATPSQKPPAKKPKPPALEDKPLQEFIEQHFLPTLGEAFSNQGMSDVELTFTKEQLQLPGTTSSEAVAQVKGNWQGGKRQFNLYFLDETLKGQKAFSCSTDGTSASTLESFMIDERKVTLDLLVLYTLQRLNGQKWLTRN
jgi:hypothetical protein